MNDENLQIAIDNAFSMYRQSVSTSDSYVVKNALEEQCVRLREIQKARAAVVDAEFLEPGTIRIQG